jgi:hypothetical protein
MHYQAAKGCVLHSAGTVYQYACRTRITQLYNAYWAGWEAQAVSTAVQLRMLPIAEMRDRPPGLDVWTVILVRLAAGMRLLVARARPR